jgi:hypothetical protein
LQTELRTIYGEKLAKGYKAFRIIFERAEENSVPTLNSEELQSR